MPPRKATLLSENHILASLPEHDYQRMLPHLKPVSLTLGEILYEADETIRHVYFPMQSVASLIWKTADETTIEVGMVGNEGMTGISIISGIKRLPYHHRHRDAAPGRLRPAARGAARPGPAAHAGHPVVGAGR